MVRKLRGPTILLKAASIFLLKLLMYGHLAVGDREGERSEQWQRCKGRSS